MVITIILIHKLSTELSTGLPYTGVLITIKKQHE